MNNKLIVVVLFLCFSAAVITPIFAQFPTIVAKSGSTPTIDGVVNDNEWNNASSVSFSGVQVFLKQDGKNLYVAFKGPVYPLTIMNVLFDVNNDRTLLPQSDDLTLGVQSNNILGEAHVVNNQWDRITPSGWTGASQTISNTIQAEFSIPYAKLNIVAGTDKTLGINFAYQTLTNPPNPGTVFWWSNSADLANPEMTPSAWGRINSTGYNWVPEASSLLILSILMVTISLILIARKKPQHRQPEKCST